MILIDQRLEHARRYNENDWSKSTGWELDDYSDSLNYNDGKLKGFVDPEKNESKNDWGKDMYEIFNLFAQIMPNPSQMYRNLSKNLLEEIGYSRQKIVLLAGEIEKITTEIPDGYGFEITDPHNVYGEHLHKYYCHGKTINMNTKENPYVNGLYIPGVGPDANYIHLSSQILYKYINNKEKTKKFIEGVLGHELFHAYSHHNDFYKHTFGSDEYTLEQYVNEMITYKRSYLYYDNIDSELAAQSNSNFDTVIKKFLRIYYPFLKKTETDEYYQKLPAFPKYWNQLPVKILIKSYVYMYEKYMNEFWYLNKNFYLTKEIKMPKFYDEFIKLENFKKIDGFNLKGQEENFCKENKIDSSLRASFKASLTKENEKYTKYNK